MSTRGHLVIARLARVDRRLSPGKPEKGRGRGWLRPLLLGGVALAAGCGDVLAPAPPVAYTDLAVGAYHACALDTDGIAWCWGRGGAGALGVGGHRDRSSATRVAMPETGFLFTRVTAAGNQTCALDDTGATFCWGTGPSVPGEVQLVPARVAGAPEFIDLSAGEGHACGLTAAGQIYCWGSNEHGQLGRQVVADPRVPSQVDGGVVFTAVSAGGRHTCGLAVGGEPFCWGDNEYGQLGDGSGVDQLLPVEVAWDHRFNQIDAGHVNTCALAGSAGWCWGAAGDGQPGDYSYYPGREPEPRPVRVGGTLFAFEFSSIHAGHLVICGVNAGERAQGMCWGNGEFGQVGNGRTGDQAGPQLITLFPAHHHNADALRFTLVDPGGVGHVCGLSADGAVFCWGSGPRGELGSGVSFSAFPRRVR